VQILNQSDIDLFKKSKQYVIMDEIFDNETQGLSEKVFERNAFSVGNIYKWLFKASDRAPLFKLPEEKPDIEKFISNTEDVSFIWFGHSSLLLNLKGTTILIDPVFSSHASPVWFAVKRFQPPVLKLEELPDIDYILISHDHFDHLDKNTIDFFIDKDVKFLTTLGV
jgi:hypothetical protein